MTYPAAVTDLYDTLFAQIGVPVTVTPPGESPIETRAVIRQNQEVQRRDMPHVVDLATTVTLPVADVSRPPRDTAVTDGTSTWYLDDILLEHEHKVQAVARDED